MNVEQLVEMRIGRGKQRTWRKLVPVSEFLPVWKQILNSRSKLCIFTVYLTHSQNLTVLLTDTTIFPGEGAYKLEGSEPMTFML
jgi:hypothetical protein